MSQRTNGYKRQIINTFFPDFLEDWIGFNKAKQK